MSLVVWISRRSKYLNNILWKGEEGEGEGGRRGERAVSEEEKERWEGQKRGWREGGVVSEEGKGRWGA